MHLNEEVGFKMPPVRQNMLRPTDFPFRNWPNSVSCFMKFRLTDKKAHFYRFRRPFSCFLTCLKNFNWKNVFFCGVVYYTMHIVVYSYVTFLFNFTTCEIISDSQKPIFWSGCANFQTPNSASFTGFPVKTENHWLYMLIYFQHSARASYCVHFLQRENLGL